MTSTNSLSRRPYPPVPAWPAEGRVVITSKPIARRDGNIRYAASLVDPANRIFVHASGDTEDEAQQAARAMYANCGIQSRLMNGNS